MANRYTRKGQEKQDAPDTADEFVGFWERSWQYVKPHTTNVAIGSAVLVGIVGVFWIGTWRWDASREDATEMFGKAVQLFEVSPTPDDKKDDKKPAAEVKKGDEDLPTFKTPKERDDKVLDQLTQLQSSHGMSSVAKQATLFRAGVLFDEGRYEDSEASYREYAKSADKGDPGKAVALEGVALTLEARGKLDEALASYKELEGSGGDFYRDRALYAEARVLARQGKKADAEKIWKDILVKTPTTSLKEEIQNQLALIGSP